MERGQPIEHKLLSGAIERAQKRMEEHNFEIRKSLLKFDNVMNRQRELIYEQRRVALEEQDIIEVLNDFTMDGPVVGPDPLRDRLDLVEAAKAR